MNSHSYLPIVSYSVLCQGLGLNPLQGKGVLLFGVYFLYIIYIYYSFDTYTLSIILIFLAHISLLLN